MGKRRGHSKQIRELRKSAQLSAKVSPQGRFSDLIAAEQYVAALDLLRRTQKSQPELQLTPGEGQLRLLLGQQELARSQYKTAETHFQRALGLGNSQAEWLGDVYYSYAKSLVLQDRCAEALRFIQTAFEEEKLPKTHAGCYLKLLLIEGQTETVKTLLEEQSKRFYAVQLHWARGILALQAKQPAAALEHFRKAKDPVTPDDHPKAWQAYARQAQADWPAAATTLMQLRQSASAQLLGKNGFLAWLDLNQRLQTGKLSRSAYERRTGWGNTKEIKILELLGLLEAGDVKQAGHQLLQLEIESKDSAFPELNLLHDPLMLAAGAQSLRDGAFDTAEAFWKDIATEQKLNIQLNFNLLYAQRQIGSSRAGLSTIDRLLSGLKQAPETQHWSEPQRQEALVRLHCFAADFQMDVGGRTPTLRAIKQAEKINPRHPEVLARRGIVAYMDEELNEAIRLLSEAIEQGCTFCEAYEALIMCFERMGDKAGKQEIRRRLGRKFGDVVEEEVDLPRWIEAIASRTYFLFESLIDPEDAEGPEEVACGCFIAAVESEPNPGGRVDVDLEQAQEQWDALLEECRAEEQVRVLQAIALCLQLFCKRIKGRDAMAQQYQQRLLALDAEVPDALKVYLVLLALKGTAIAAKQIRPHLLRYLKRSAEPGTALAQVQLTARWFGQADVLLPFIDEALQKEPQNPQLLLAKATLYPLDSKFYEQYKNQGFEIARRLQDAPALQAFRDEQAFETHWRIVGVMPTRPAHFDPRDPASIDRVIEQMIRKLVGPDAPEDVVRSMIPLLRQKMLEEEEGFFDFDFEDEDEEDGIPFPIDLINLFGQREAGGRSRDRSKRRR